MKNLTTGLIAIAMIITIGLACSNSDTTKTDNSTPKPTTSNNSNDNKTTTNSNSSTSSSNGDITGTYSVIGKNPSGKDYKGDLAVKKQDAVYQFTWSAGGSSYDGVGIQGGNLVAAGFTTGADGKGCGAAIYKIGNTSMEGRFASWGFNSTATQTATLVSNTKTSGKFTLEGTDTDGTPYTGTLDIKQNGRVFQLTYGGKVVFHGTGIRQGDYLAVGVGKSTCGFAVYEIKNGNLEGIWGGIGTNKVGAEIATRK